MVRAETLYSPSEERIMIRYMNIEEQLDYDFTRALRKAFLRRMQARIFGDPASTHMRSFEDVSNELGAWPWRR